MKTKRISFFMLVTAFTLVMALASVPGLAASRMRPVAFGRFSAENLRGDGPVTEAIFQDAKITLLNFWATWCGPCVSELADLARLHELSDGRAQVLGVLLDGLNVRGEKDEAAVARAHALLDGAQAEYAVVVPDEWLMRLASLAAVIPTTFVVDETGAILTTVVGARTAEQWLALMDEVLTEE
ncbi:MAG: TlpA family protein disulfide reductase [Firmicutes bacterium]|nr:TlpA family protein disulfide reductase [Bacillota bacterium]